MIRIQSLSILLPLLLALLAAPSCARSPEHRVHDAFASLCSGDPQGFARHLTARSRTLFEGLRTVRPEAFACTSPVGLEVQETNRMREGLRILRVTADGRHTDVALIQEGGEWRLDLFYTEEAAFYAGYEEERP
jgi:hypothetical protein